jgi:hypothetical protein
MHRGLTTLIAGSPHLGTLGPASAAIRIKEVQYDPSGKDHVEQQEPQQRVGENQEHRRSEEVPEGLEAEGPGRPRMTPTVKCVCCVVEDK